MGSDELHVGIGVPVAAKSVDGMGTKAPKKNNKTLFSFDGLHNDDRR